ncbi:hypothetical protein BMS3Abin04_00497 [bacterium BMS3Abin04]|nr:hypothetical protein BMS3Abin04_00497 [bacterium BMS3Abin04]
MKQIYKTVIVFLSGLLIVSCSTQRYSVKNPSSSDKHNYALSESGKLRVEIPAGWFKAIDNDKKLIDLWLVKDDYSASIKFIPIVIHNSSSSNLESAVFYSKIFLKTSVGNNFRKFISETNDIFNSKAVSFYKVLLKDGRLLRCAVFEEKGNYYENIINYLKPASVSEIDELFNVQTDLLKSLVPRQIL